MSHDTFFDHDLLPATTSHAALSAEVARLRSRLEQLQVLLERCSHKRNEIGGALDAEREMHERTRVEVKRLEVEHYDDVEHITQIARLEEATRGERDHLAIVVATLRQAIELSLDHFGHAMEGMGEDVLTEVLAATQDAAQVNVTAIQEPDAARQALRNLVDATSWYGDKQSGHIQVNEDAMTVAMGLVVAWFAEEEKR